jgi:hypothetical protein
LTVETVSFEQFALETHLSCKQFVRHVRWEMNFAEIETYDGDEDPDFHFWSHIGRDFGERMKTWLELKVKE